MEQIHKWERNKNKRKVEKKIGYLVVISSIFRSLATILSKLIPELSTGC